MHIDPKIDRISLHCMRTPKEIYLVFGCSEEVGGRGVADPTTKGGYLGLVRILLYFDLKMRILKRYFVLLLLLLAR